VTPLRAGALAAAGLLLALAATLGPAHLPGAEPGASLVVRLPDTVWMIVVGLFGASLLLFFSLQRPRRRVEDESELGDARVQTRRRSFLLASLPTLLLLILFIYIVWAYQTPEGGHPFQAPLDAIAGLLNLLSQTRKPETSVAAFDWAVAGMALAVALAVFVLMVLVVFAERLLRWWDRPTPARPLPPLERAVAESLDDLRTDTEPRAAIIRIYRRFELALATARVPRAAWQTPTEFMRTVLAQAALPTAPVERLTTLFELARFSERPLGAEARADAFECLDAVKTALEANAAHAR
jgi:heme/copper-type cytochrome/quinol oxidase subunit 2